MAALLPAWALGSDPFQSTVSGDSGALPNGYAPPLISNGSLCMQIDYQGCQFQQPYAKMTPGIWWAGRRYEPSGDASKQLVPFGHFEQELSLAGTALKAPLCWSQTLNTKEALVTCQSEYAEGLSVETQVFTLLAQDLIVIKKRLCAKDGFTPPAKLTFKYQFTPPGNENRVPRRTTCKLEWNATERSADFRYQLDGHRPCEGLISVMSDQPVTAKLDGQAVALTSELALQAAHSVDQTFYLLFADSLDGKDYLGRAAQRKAQVRQKGFDGLLASHREEWSKYWDESYIQLPDERLQKAYCTAQYHLRANATKWSFPVGIFPTHWAGKFFGWDEMFCYQALVSSNHHDIARRCPEFRFAGLQKALYRASHYGKPGLYGARYPWETLEDGSEGAPPGFWMDHVFHISNIATSAWFQFLYTNDLAYLKGTGYPVIRECARFFFANMIYEAPDGGRFFGKCTDLERLGPARQNPFMTSCGAIYTLEAAATAAELLQAEQEESAAWKDTAKRLRASLPAEGNRYVPYAGCAERSIASMGGLFPYPVFDETSERQRNAALDFIEHGRASGNMYPVGNSVCAWYAGWMAAGLAALGDQTEPVKLLSEAAAGTGCFGELFEINEAKVSMRPWFATASGNVVYALNQLLVQSRGNEIRIAPAVPATWKDYAFKLACHGDLVVEAEVKGGRLMKLLLVPGAGEVEQQRALVIPAALLDGQSLNATVAKSTSQAGKRRLEIRFKGRTEMIERSLP